MHSLEIGPMTSSLLVNLYFELQESSLRYVQVYVFVCWYECPLHVISDWSTSVRNTFHHWFKSDWSSQMESFSRRPWDPEKMSKHNLWPQELLNGQNKAAAHVSAINISLVFFYKVTGWHFTLDIGHIQTNSQRNDR